MTNDQNDQLPRSAGPVYPERVARLPVDISTHFSRLDDPVDPVRDPSDPGPWFPDDVEQLVLATAAADWPPGWRTPAEIVAALTARRFWATVDLAWLNDAGRGVWLRHVLALSQYDVAGWMRPEVYFLRDPSNSLIWEASEGKHRLSSVICLAAERARAASDEVLVQQREMRRYLGVPLARGSEHIPLWGTPSRPGSSPKCVSPSTRCPRRGADHSRARQPPERPGGAC